MYFKGDMMELVWTDGVCDDDCGRKRYKEERVAAFVFARGGEGEGSDICAGE